MNIQEALRQLSFREEVPERRKRWAKYTEGIKDNYDRRTTEVLLEQQLNHILNMNKSQITEATHSTNIALFKKFALPVIPKVYPTSFIRNLISIQPIPLPTAKVFYKDFLRSTGGTSTASKDDFDRTYADRGVAPHEQPVATPPSSELPTASVTNEGATVKKLKLKMTSADIVAKSKALGYEFSAELNQDLMAYHGVSADAELGAECAAEIQREIEYDIINGLLSGASAGNVNWSAQPLASDTKTIDMNAYKETIYHAVIDARNLVFKKRYVNPTWIVCHPDLAVRFEKLSGFEYEGGMRPTTISQGRQFFGTIRNTIQVFSDPWFPQPNKALLGYKGTGPFDVGYVHAPYIPFYSTKLHEDPGTMESTRSLLSRQADAMLVADMYATLTITNAS